MYMICWCKKRWLCIIYKGDAAARRADSHLAALVSTAIPANDHHGRPDCRMVTSASEISWPKFVNSRSSAAPTCRLGRVRVLQRGAGHDGHWYCLWRLQRLIEEGDACASSSRKLFLWPWLAFLSPPADKVSQFELRKDSTPVCLHSPRKRLAVSQREHPEIPKLVLADMDTGVEDEGGRKRDMRVSEPWSCRTDPGIARSPERVAQCILLELEEDDGSAGIVRTCSSLASFELHSGLALSNPDPAAPAAAAGYWRRCCCYPWLQCSTHSSWVLKLLILVPSSSRTTALQIPLHPVPIPCDLRPRHSWVTNPSPVRTPARPNWCTTHNLLQISGTSTHVCRGSGHRSTLHDFFPRTIPLVLRSIKAGPAVAGTKICLEVPVSTGSTRTQVSRLTPRVWLHLQNFPHRRYENLESDETLAKET